ncbi:MAG: GNAT family N-acetyltransferase [Gaiellaceae bacterium]
MDLTDGVLVLRPPTADDVPAVEAACQDPEIPRWIPMIPRPYTAESAREFVDWSRERTEAGDHSFVIVSAAGGELLGAIGMSVNARMRNGHVGYWVAAHARRTGVASGALRLLASWALGEGGFGRLELVTDPDNHASQAVAEKVGFRREGILRSHIEHRDGRRRDSVMFSLLPGEIQ